MNFSDIVHLSRWELEDYSENNSITQLDIILSQFFAPINEAVNEFDDTLSGMEQSLTTALKRVRNLMSFYRDEDKIDQRFVL